MSDKSAPVLQGDGAPEAKFDIPEMHMWFVGTVTVTSSGAIERTDALLVAPLTGRIS
jgi:hypothetical protein